MGRPPLGRKRAQCVIPAAPVWPLPADALLLPQTSRQRHRRCASCVNPFAPVTHRLLHWAPTPTGAYLRRVAAAIIARHEVAQRNCTLTHRPRPRPLAAPTGERRIQSTSQQLRHRVQPLSDPTRYGPSCMDSSSFSSDSSAQMDEDWHLWYRSPSFCRRILVLSMSGDVDVFYSSRGFPWQWLGLCPGPGRRTLPAS